MIKFQNTKFLLDNYFLVLIVFIAVNFFFDFIDKIEIFYKYEFLKWNRYLKLVFVLYNIYFLYKNSEYIFKKARFILFTFILISAFFFLKNNFSFLYLNEYFRYSFGLITIPLIHYLHDQQREKLLPVLYKLFKYFILINTFAIVVGVLLNVHVFRSYESYRMGYNGLILSQGVSPYIYLSATVLFWAMRDKKMILLTLLVSAVSGIKGVYFAEFLVLILLILTDKNLSIRIKIWVGFVLILGLSTTLFFVFKQPLFQNILDSDGIMPAIFSFRTDYALELFEKINSSNFSYLVGALKLDEVRLELQFLDIYLFLGILGLITYVVFLSILYKKFVKSRVSRIFFFVAILLSALAGNLFYIPVSSLLFFFILFALQAHYDVMEEQSWS